jgi:cobalt-zinc-cadmium efflux system outer membrane protein
MFKQFACLIACSVFMFLAVVPISRDARAQDVASPSLDAAEIADVAQFVDAILVAHPDLLAANAALEEAAARERSADRPVYNPDFEFDAVDSEDESIEVGLSQQVDWAGKQRAAYAVSGAARRAAQAEYLAARNAIAANIFQLLSEYWTGAELVNLASTNQRVMHDFAQQARMRFQAGDIMQVEYETAQLAYAEVRMRKAELVAKQAAVVHSLAAFGAPVDTIAWPKIPDTLPQATIQPLDANKIIETLPRVAAAKALADAAAAEVELAESLKKPDPTFGVRVGEENDESLVGVSFSIPLYVRNNFNEDVLASLAAKSKAEAEADVIERDARARLMVAIDRYTTLRAAWADWEQTGSSSLERRAELLKTLWDAREIDMSDFLLQINQTLTTQETAVELRQILWEAWIGYLKESNQVESWFHPGSTAPARDDNNLSMRQEQ